MKRVSTVLLAFALALLALAGGLRAAPAAPVPGTCLENWSDAAPIVANEGLIPAREIQLLARRQHGRDLVRITLCREATGYVYRLLLRDDRGHISHGKIDALPLPATVSSTLEH